jgi:serine/threonine-protein kinase HipA
VQIESLTALDRLAYIGNKGMGALSYEPDYAIYNSTYSKINLETLAQESLLTLKGDSDTAIFELLSLNGSAGGARPKIAVSLSLDKKKLIHGMEDLPDTYEHWLIKFPALSDHKDIGAIEYAYSLMARAAGIEIMPTYLFKGKYFGVKRFDREGARKIHVHTASGLLHADHHYPSLDYENLLKLCLVLTNDMREVGKLYRLAVFNVLAHNRDDHSKNFSFMMNEQGKWKFAPAYDLTYSYGPGGEHSMLVMGEGKNPGKEHLMKLAAAFGLKKANEIYDEVECAISRWDEFADEAGVTKKSRGMVGNSLGFV